MFEKWSPVKSSVSWGGFGAVWVQTPRQAKETHSSFATSCTLAEQARPHQNCRPLQIFINSPLLTSPLVFPWNKRTHKILSPLLFPSKRLSPWEETKTCSHPILSDQGRGFWHSCSAVGGIVPTHSEAVSFLFPAQPCQDAHTTLLGMGNCLPQLQPQSIEPREASEIYVVIITLCRALENPTQILPVRPTSIHLAPPSLGHLEYYLGALVS